MTDYRGASKILNDLLAVLHELEDAIDDIVESKDMSARTKSRSVRAKNLKRTVTLEDDIVELSEEARQLIAVLGLDS